MWELSVQQEGSPTLLEAVFAGNARDLLGPGSLGDNTKQFYAEHFAPEPCAVYAGGLQRWR